MKIKEVDFGADFIKLTKLLNEELLQIEKENNSYFKERKPKFEGEKHDRLHNHWILYREGDKVSFGFNNDSDISEQIKKKCYTVFYKVFKQPE